MGGSRSAATCLACALAWACTAPPSAPPARLAPSATSRRARAEPLTQPLVIRDVGFDSPESVLHDVEADVYLVSNVVGAAAERDGRAFISRVRPDGSIEKLRWIDGAQASVELNAPKGMAIARGVLYVADIDCVRKFDHVTGRALGSVRVEGASFLHDVAAEPSGDVYVSDSGLGPGLSPSGSDAIYRIDARGRVKPLVRSTALGQPSGVWLTPESLWVVSFGSGELYRITREGVQDHVERLAKGSLDGLAISGDRVYVSSWEGAAIYERTDGGVRELLGDMEAPADLSVDETRRRLLVTHYNANSLSIHAL